MSGGVLILLGAEPAQPLIVREHTQRVTAGDKHVYSEIEFIVVNEKRLVDVFLADIAFCWLNLFYILSYEDSFSLTTGLWFENEVSGMYKY